MVSRPFAWQAIPASFSLANESSSHQPILWKGNWSTSALLLPSAGPKSGTISVQLVDPSTKTKQSYFVDWMKFYCQFIWENISPWICPIFPCSLCKKFKLQCTGPNTVKLANLANPETKKGLERRAWERNLSKYDTDWRFPCLLSTLKTAKHKLRFSEGEAISSQEANYWMEFGCLQATQR